MAFVVSAGCGGSSGSSSANGITIAISPTTASLALDAVQEFTATVTNDSTNRGVAWSLTQNGVTCAPACGTIYPIVTASGTPTVYTAPPVVPGGGPGLTLTATAISNSKASASIAVVVAGSISVQVTPATVTVALSTSSHTVTQYFSGDAPNDTTSDGLTWALTQNGTACSPGCGTIKSGINFSCPSNVTPPSGGFCTANGGTAIYTAPITAPSDPNVLITATDIAAPGENGFAQITLQAPTVSISPTFAQVAVNGTQTFAATLASITANNGVNWALSQNGASCSSSACGTISSTSSTSGSKITFTAPSSPTTVTLTATSAADTSISVFATIEVEPVSITVSPTTAILYANGTTNFISSVKYDALQKGVTWTLTQSSGACTASTCGTLALSNTGANSGVKLITPDGTQITYTAPSSIASALPVTLTGTSISDTTKSDSAVISLYPPVGVSLSPTSPAIVLGSRQTFTATVTNDPTQAGVAWSLTQGGSPCAPTCGIVSPTSTTGNTSSSVYIAPTTMPSTSTVTLVATAEAQLTQSASTTITLSTSGTLAKFSGDYAFLVSGYDSAGPVAMAGTLSADGGGTVTGGTADVNRASGVTTALPIAGSYTITSNGMGSLTLTDKSQGTILGTFQIALNGSGDAARMIESSGAGTSGWGSLNRRSGAVSESALHGDYAFSAAGTDPRGLRYSLAGKFHADGAGGISAGVLDANDGGLATSQAPFSGHYTITSSGRGTLTANTPEGLMRWAFYLVSPGHIDLISIDPGSSAAVTAGEALAQSVASSAAGFTTASLDGSSVLTLAGLASDGVGSKVEAGVVTFDGAGGLRYSLDCNDGGELGNSSGSGSYSIERDGRVTMWLAPDSAPLVLYLVAPNQGLTAGTGPSASSGELDAQSPGEFSESTLSGSYIMGTEAATSGDAQMESGVLTSAGAGRLAGAAARMVPGTAMAATQSLQDAYTVAPNGRVVMASGNSILYLISPSEAVVLDAAPGDAFGTISRIEK